jgi:hypothetical protein
MVAQLQVKFDRLEAILGDTLAYTDQLSPDKKHAAPPNEWSATQILYHLQISEMGTLGYLEKKLQAPPSEVEKAGIAGWLRSKLLRRALKNMKKKFKAPSILGEMPAKPDYNAVKSGLIETRKKLKNVLEKVTKEQVGRAYFKHPRAGKINLLQTMDFLDDHFSRHAQQIRERSA